MKNPYKRSDVFSCNFRSHSRFENRVSAYHVLRAKKCWPQGCIYYRWSCELKNKGKSCRRGFAYIGRLCEGCSHFHDEKVHYQPRLLLNEDEYRRFLCELEEFDEWIEENRWRETEAACEIESVKPHFRKTFYGNKAQLRLAGYLAVARRGYIGLVDFDDCFYLYLSPHQQEQMRLAAGDRLEFRGRVSLDRGRLVFQRTRSLQIIQKSGRAAWSNSQALVARCAATEFDRQPAGCIRCMHGALIDVTLADTKRSIPQRALYCLQGVKEPEWCTIPLFEKVDNCRN
ncbi:MAG: hypothetical protein ONB24_03125 [candidate division KSB1 bacterium]|nr:hypothetical protein [candidate division KSB1 bacterium]